LRIMSSRLDAWLLALMADRSMVDARDIAAAPCDCCGERIKG
jgi:hypothetical protein